MDDQIDEVKAEKGEAGEMVVEREGEEADIPAAGEIKEVGEVFYPGIVHDIDAIIKMEGSGEGIGVNQCGDQADEQKGCQGVGQQSRKRRMGLIHIPY